MNNQENDIEDLDAAIEEEQYTVPSGWLSILLVVQIGIIGLLIYLISDTFIHNNDVVAIALYLAIPIITGGLLIYSWKKADLKRNQTILQIVFIIFGAYISISILLKIGYYLLELLFRFIFKDSGGWL